jgi:hypothetical protein
MEVDPFMAVTYYNALDFELKTLLPKKGTRKVYVVFSTFGEREANLIYDKILLLNNELGDFVDMFFLSHRRAGERPELTEEKARLAHDNIEIVICNTLNVPDMGDERGKGADMRRTLYHINCTMRGDCAENEIIVVFLDADVVPEHFGRHFVLGLAGAVLQGYDFAKASFWREMGRVKKYVAQPLFSVIDNPKVRMLTEFSYPLSGEVAGTLQFFNAVRFWQMYGVETGINIDSCFGDFSVADVNLGLYDHEHHPDLNIQKMSFGIIRTFFLQMIDYGIIELKDHSQIADIFKATFIDEKGERHFLEFNLQELKYKPLNTLF